MIKCNNSNMTIFICADHAGFKLKEELKSWLTKSGYEVKDFGAYILNPDDDYPDFVIPAVKAVAEKSDQYRGVVIGGSGQGEAMAANKVKGVRAAVVYDKYSAKMSRKDNDANVISFGARVLDAKTAKKLLKLWLEIPFSGDDRHARRIKKITEVERG